MYQSGKRISQPFILSDPAAGNKPVSLRRPVNPQAKQYLALRVTDNQIDRNQRRIGNYRLK